MKNTHPKTLKLHLVGPIGGFDFSQALRKEFCKALLCELRDTTLTPLAKNSINTVGQLCHPGQMLTGIYGQPRQLPKQNLSVPYRQGN